MTDFDTQHPRDTTDGQFVTKGQSAPELELDTIAYGRSVVPDELVEQWAVLETQRRAIAKAELDYDLAVGTAFEAHIRSAFPTATSVVFRCGEESWSQVPEAVAVLEGDTELWTNDTTTEVGDRIQAYANEIRSPFQEGSLLQQVEDPFGDYRNFEFELDSWRPGS